jgi:hypothetical protein
VGLQPIVKLALHPAKAAICCIEQARLTATAVTYKYFMHWLRNGKDGLRPVETANNLHFSTLGKAGAAGVFKG